jgi:wobble nucleotide-excising tRNase|tara:strand:- start:24869 stop:25057 length:189 start_codon:yes stop_codon:yes gene_type:complete
MINQALARDESGAVVNTDVVALNKYKSERALYRKVDQLTKELVNVKACLKRLSDKIDQIENN